MFYNEGIALYLSFLMCSDSLDLHFQHLTLTLHNKAHYIRVQSALIGLLLKVGCFKKLSIFQIVRHGGLSTMNETALEKGKIVFVVPEWNYRCSVYIYNRT